jgi:hypothetical protein
MVPPPQPPERTGSPAAGLEDDDHGVSLKPTIRGLLLDLPAAGDRHRVQDAAESFLALGHLDVKAELDIVPYNIGASS